MDIGSPAGASGRTEASHTASAYCEWENYFEEDVSRALDIERHRVEVLAVRPAAPGQARVDLNTKTAAERAGFCFDPLEPFVPKGKQHEVLSFSLKHGPRLDDRPRGARRCCVKATNTTVLEARGRPRSESQSRS